MNQLIYLDSVVKMPLMKLPVRSVIAPTSKGNVLISPGSQLKAEDYKKIKSVSDIVAPNLLHSGGVAIAAAQFPNAKKWGPRNIGKRNQHVQWDAELSLQNWPYQDELALIEIEGVPQMKEFVFLHKASKTLILTDLCFNVTSPQGLGAWIILNLFGTYKKFAMSRLWLRVIKDKNLLRKSLNKLLELDFENIVVSHGDDVRGGAKELFIKALQERKVI